MSDKNKIGSTEGGGITGLAGWAGLGCHKDTIIHSQAWNTHSIVLVAGSLLVRLRGLFAIKQDRERAKALLLLYYHSHSKEEITIGNVM